MKCSSSVKISVPEKSLSVKISVPSKGLSEIRGLKNIKKVFAEYIKKGRK